MTVLTAVDVGMFRPLVPASMALIEGTSKDNACELEPTEIPVVTMYDLDVEIPTLAAEEMDVIEIHEVNSLPDSIKRRDPVKSKSPKALPVASTCRLRAVAPFPLVALIVGRSKDTASELLPILPAAVTMMRSVAHTLDLITWHAIDVSDNH